MVKIINIHTKEERTHEPPELPKCEICSYEVNVNAGGISGNIGRLPISFCSMCISSIIGMLVDKSEKEEE